MGKKTKKLGKPESRRMSLEEWARAAGISPVALKAMRLRFRETERCTAEEWMDRYDRMMLEAVRHT